MNAEAVLSDAQNGDRLLLVHDLGVVAYDEAYAYQREMARRRIAGEVPQDVLILCEHPPVITIGRRTKPGHLLASEVLLRERGIALREVERGGDITVHEPGQLVAYPIVDLKRHTQDLHWYLRQLEAAIMATCAILGVSTARRAGLTGVWCGSDEGGWRKLASIGVHARDWVTWHGLALNVNNTLATFAHVVPCGIPDAVMTSLAREEAALDATASGAAAGVPASVKRGLANDLASTFGLQARELASR